MGRYTEYLEGRADAIRVEDENYAEELLAIAQTFRSLDEALSGFIRAHGYEGQEDPAEKSAFVRTRFEEAQIPVPRGIKSGLPMGIIRSAVRMRCSSALPFISAWRKARTFSAGSACSARWTATTWKKPFVTLRCVMR